MIQIREDHMRFISELARYSNSEVRFFFTVFLNKCSEDSTVTMDWLIFPWRWRGTKCLLPNLPNDLLFLNIRPLTKLVLWVVLWFRNWQKLFSFGLDWKNFFACSIVLNINKMDLISHCYRLFVKHPAWIWFTCKL